MYSRDRKSFSYSFNKTGDRDTVQLFVNDTVLTVGEAAKHCLENVRAISHQITCSTTMTNLIHTCKQEHTLEMQFNCSFNVIARTLDSSNSSPDGI